MWIQRDFSRFISSISPNSQLPIKILKGPRQVGKTSLLSQLKTHHLVLFDDLSVRNLAQENPRLFLEQMPPKCILDEATLAPNIFHELKRRVDEHRLHRHDSDVQEPGLDVWVTGSNQTLLKKSVQESLSGRANYFTLNTLSLHEIYQNQEIPLASVFMKGGWPELYASPQINPVQYLNDFIATFIEKDIVQTAGIEKRSAFSKMLQLCSTRIGQLLNYSDIAQNIGVDVSTVQAWIGILEQNGIVRIIEPYFNNLNQRLIKTPKLYFEDVALAVRLQGWTDFSPLYLSPYWGSLLENLAFIEISRFFSNQGQPAQIYFVRSKEKVEFDFLIRLPNEQWIAAEVKNTPMDFTENQSRLAKSLGLNILENWCLSPTPSPNFSSARSVLIRNIFSELERHMESLGY